MYACLTLIEHFVKIALVENLDKLMRFLTLYYMPLNLSFITPNSGVFEWVKFECFENWKLLFFFSFQASGGSVGQQFGLSQNESRDCRRDSGICQRERCLHHSDRNQVNITVKALKGCWKLWPWNYASVPEVSKSYLLVILKIQT
jgi:hypothetical protein